MFYRKADWVGCPAQSPGFKNLPLLSEIIRMQQKLLLTESLIY